MGKENGINFNQKFTTYLSKNIKLDDLFNEKDKDKFKQSMGSIFNAFDTGNKDGTFDSKEINNIISALDSNKDRNISDDEIKAYSETNGIDKKILKSFIERIANNLPGATAKNSATNRPSMYSGPLKDWYDINSTQYGEDFIRYNTHADSRNGTTHNNSAIYDIKNDKLLPMNTNQGIEITGVKEFQNLAFKDGTFKKPGNDFNNWPKIVIKGENGENTEIEVRIRNIDMSAMKDEQDYMFLMTNLTNALSNLPANVLEDLKNNVSFISLKSLAYGTAGTAGSSGETLDEYKEFINLDVPDGLIDNLSTLTHEIGHTVDNGISGYATDKNTEKIKTFIENLNMSDIPDNLKLSYATKNPRELFAEYYTYSNLKDKGGSHLKESNQLFGILERSLNNGDPYGWKEIKEILDGTKDKSLSMTNEYINVLNENEAYFVDLNNQDGAIPEDRMSKYDTEMLWDAYNNPGIRDKFESIVTNFPELSTKYKNGTPEEQLAIINKMRNHPEFKSTLESCFAKMDADIAESERIENLPYKEALTELEQRFNKEQTQKLKRESVDAKLSGDLDVLSSQDLRNVIIDICKNRKNIPKSIRDKFQEGSTGPISKEIVLALRNEPDMWYFLIFKRDYFKHK